MISASGSASTPILEAAGNGTLLSALIPSA